MDQYRTVEEDDDLDHQGALKATRAFLTSAKRPGLNGCVSIVLTLMSTIWFTMCFTAREAAWWNSSFWFLLFYAAAVAVALRGIRSLVGVVALLLALMPLILVLILIVVR